MQHVGPAPGPRRPGSRDPGAPVNAFGARFGCPSESVRPESVPRCPHKWRPSTAHARGARTAKAGSTPHLQAIRIRHASRQCPRSYRGTGRCAKSVAGAPCVQSFVAAVWQLCSAWRSRAQSAAEQEGAGGDDSDGGPLQDGAPDSVSLRPAFHEWAYLDDSLKRNPDCGISGGGRHLLSEAGSFRPARLLH